MRLLLGSLSPRRREILGFFSCPFEVAAPEFDEERIVFHGDPAAFAEAAAKGKAASLRHRYPEHLILAADTVVFKAGQLFLKPKSHEEGFAMLKSLNGSCHSVFTSVTALYKEREKTVTEETKVYFHTLDETQLQLYHRAFQGTDKAGGYGIQEAGSLIVRRIEGCFYNVMGLPLGALQTVLKETGFDLWNYLG